MADPVKLVVIPFLQKWDATSQQLSLRILIVPRDSFIVPFVPNDLNSLKFFPNAKLVFDVRLLSGLQDGLPTPGSGASPISVTFTPDPSYGKVFKALVSTFGNIITKTPKRARDPEDFESISVRKHLPVSYRDATGYTPGGGNMFTTGNEYSCAMKQVRLKNYKLFTPREFNPSWGELIASILRIPDFASTAGFIRTTNVTVPSNALADGGYVWLELTPQSAADIGVSDTAPMKTFAARILPLSNSADLFTPLSFPVLKPADLPSIPGATYDMIFREAEDYADGWAKAVHCVQPQSALILTENPSNSRPAKDLGVRLGWDDEQVTIWADRHVDPAKAAVGLDNFPLGIHGYRVDVLDVASNTWFSLARATGKFGIKDQEFGNITSELGVEVHPTTSLDVVEDRSYWMPMYFTNWAQTSLVGTDEATMKLLGRYKTPPGLTAPGFPHLGVTDPALQLRYGRNYKFRVRLMDHTGGGPTLGSTAGTLGPSPTPSITFRRWIKPLTPQFVGTMPILDNKPGAETPVDFIQVTRPLMFYPAVMFAGYKYNGKDAITELMAMADELNANPPAPTAKATEPGLPDPDVDRVEITVLVQTLTQDPLAKDGPYMVLYTTTWAMPTDLKANALIPFKWTDEPDIWNPTDPWTGSTAYLLLPRARTIRLRINALCRDEPRPGDPYFGADDVRHGAQQLIIPLRKNAVTEPELFVRNPPSYTINGFFLQPTLDAASQLATALGLRSKDTTLRAPRGKRVVFACGSSIMHVLGPDRASLTFASQSSLASQWIIVIRLTMERDWSWDGFPVDGISVNKGTQNVVIFAPNQNANEDAVSGPAPDRSTTDLVIVDVINPKPPPGVKPTEINVKYTLTTKFLGAASTTAGPTMDLSIDLPVTTPPAQIPQLASAGIAMSPYLHDDAYTTTLPRTKTLWVEFVSSLEDPQDRYFCRILKYAPDPLLLDSQFAIDSTTEDTTTEPPIPLDPEPIRRIVPLQSLDTAGLDAMQPLIPTSSPYHWGIPLPPGVTSENLDLFGFWTYEFRVGHWNDATHTRWSTAQGRFGPAYRVAGVQHPLPALVCSLSRDPSVIRVSARWAQPTQDGKPVTFSKGPATQMWFLLYAQAAQMDASGEKRNILVGRVRAVPREQEGGELEQPVASFTLREVNFLMAQYGLRPGVGLSAMAVEMVSQRDQVKDPLGGDLGRQRILRTSCLVAVPNVC